MSKLYYTPPTNEAFEEVKEKAIELWKTYDDTYKYALNKIDKIKDIKNISDNFMYIVAMFDLENQAKLANKLSETTKRAISERIIDGGGSDEYNMFN